MYVRSSGCRTSRRSRRRRRGVEGIINLRGSVIPVVDLRQRFGMATSNNSPETRIVVVDTEDETVGLVVNAVTEVITVGTSSIEPVGNLAAAAASSDLRGIVNLPEKLIILISLEHLLGSVSGRVRVPKTMTSRWRRRYAVRGGRAHGPGIWAGQASAGAARGHADIH